MSTITITGTGTDSNGVVANYTVIVTTDSFALTAVVTPQTAAPGTSRNLTVTTVGGVAPFTYDLPTAAGITFTPVAGLPNQWTFVY